MKRLETGPLERLPGVKGGFDGKQGGRVRPEAANRSEVPLDWEDSRNRSSCPWRASPRSSAALACLVYPMDRTRPRLETATAPGSPGFFVRSVIRTSCGIVDGLSRQGGK